MSTQKIVMTAVIVNERILQGKGVKQAVRFRIPGNLFCAPSKPTLWSVLLDDHDLLVTPKRLRDSGDIDRLHRMAGDHRDRSACSLKTLRKLHRFLHDHSIRQDADVAAALNVTQLAKCPGIDSLISVVRFAGLADA